MAARKIGKADVFKFVGLIAFFLLMAVIIALLWPYLGEMLEPGGIERMLDEVRNAGPSGVFILLGLQFLQIVVAFIPGEGTQIAAGLLYGPWLGALIILVGCVISSAFIFLLVRKLGAPFVQGIVPVKQLDKFRKFEKTGKLNILVFVLFLIPGLPKDTFTYLVPLTDMRMRDFVLLSNIGRTPAVLVSTYAADGLADGRIVESIVIFAVTAGIAVLGLIFHERLMEFFGKLIPRDHNAPSEEGEGRFAEEAADDKDPVGEAEGGRGEDVEVGEAADAAGNPRKGKAADAAQPLDEGIAADTAEDLRES